MRAHRMRLGILTTSPTNYSARRLLDAAMTRGHEVAVVDTTRCYMNITASHPEVMLYGEPLRFDGIIPRVSANVTFYGTAVVRQFEMMGVYSAISSLSISRSRDKLRALQILSREGIPMPVTGFARSPFDIDGVIQAVGGAPLIVKLLEGSQGVGVVLAETQKAAESVIAAFQQLNANILVQAFIEEAAGEDIRAFVIGDQVVAAMRRRAAEGNFRANLHQGGTATAVELRPRERRLALAAAKALGLRIAGVDMLPTKNGPLVIEVNSSPGLEGIEGCSGADIAGAIIAFVEDGVTLNRKKRVEA
jgi:ribosomal protein S6--L-glutamate ligase